MMDFIVKIKDWWAVEAMITSHNHAWDTAYKSTYEERGPIGVTDYGSARMTPYRFEFYGLSSNPRVVIEAIRNYPLGESDKYILNVFHASPSVPEHKAKYQSLGYDFIRTGPILGRDLPPSTQRNDISHTHKADTIRKAEHANETLTDEGERIPLNTLRGKQIHNYYANVSNHAVGWAQMVTSYPDVGYIHRLYTMVMYRGLKVGSTLVERAQIEAVQMGLRHMLMVPSDMALGLAIRLGYRPLAYITIFRPADEETEDAET